jgi:uncharacterized protein (DUF2147 family)
MLWWRTTDAKKIKISLKIKKQINMTKYIFPMMALLALTILGAGETRAQAGSKSEPDAILGEWMNAEKDASFLIYKKNGKYFGKITWGTGGDTKDSKNPDPALRKRDLVGLTILNNFVYTGENVWENGRIYDPKDGKTYDCKMTLKDKNTIDVRGYVGFSQFGRTETWTRK